MNIALECGLYRTNGMGIQSIGWSDINSYFHMTGRHWPWLASTVKMLSSAYVSEFNDAKDPSRPSPYQDRLDIDLNRDNVKQQLKNFIKAKRKVD